MSDVTEQPQAEVAEPSAKDQWLAGATAAFDARVNPVLSQIPPGALVNGHLAGQIAAALKAGVLAMMTYDGPEAETEAPRDETHDSIDANTGALTPEATARRAEIEAQKAAEAAAAEPVA